MKSLSFYTVYSFTYHIYALFLKLPEVYNYFKIKRKSIKCLEENIECVNDLKVEKTFIAKTEDVETIKRKMNKYDYTKVRNFFMK